MKRRERSKGKEKTDRDGKETDFIDKEKQRLLQQVENERVKRKLSQQRKLKK